MDVMSATTFFTGCPRAARMISFPLCVAEMRKKIICTNWKLVQASLGQIKQYPFWVHC